MPETRTGRVREAAEELGERTARVPEPRQAPETGEEAGRQATRMLPTERLAQEAHNLLDAVAERTVSAVGDRVESLTGRLLDYVENGGTSLVSALTGAQATGGAVGGALKGGLKGAFKGAFQKLTGGGKGKDGASRGGGLKVTNIVESIDIGAPRHAVYNRWTRFEDFPTFMKKVENVKQTADEKLDWKAQIFWSHRHWASQIVEQVPDRRIVWRSTGAKGHVDGAVTFHELAPDLTRVLVVLEYHPQGLFERTGNLWRAQGRRVRLELKHFRRHVMAELLPRLDEVADDGWRGEIQDGRVVKDHETALREEQAEQAAEEEAEAERPREPAAEEARPEEARPEEEALGEEASEAEGPGAAEEAEAFDEEEFAEEGPEEEEEEEPEEGPAEEFAEEEPEEGEPEEGPAAEEAAEEPEEERPARGTRQRPAEGDRPVRRRPSRTEETPADRPRRRSAGGA